MPNRDGDIASHNQAVKRNPSLTHPWGRKPEEYGFVWIHINARKILDQYSKGAGKIITREGAPEVQYAFLAPLNITETVSHNWAEYDSISSRIAQKVRTAAKIGAEFQSIVDSFSRNTEDKAKAKGLMQQKSVTAANSLASFARGVYNRISPHSIPKIKVDTPLYYENSARRTFTFEVILVAEKDPRMDVVEPVKDLMKWSSPALKGQGGVDIDFPYMFEVYTRPQEFIKFSTMALTAVQPTYQSPYIAGYPSSCILQLTFQDLSPLYRSAIETGSVIKVLRSNETREREARGEAPTAAAGANAGRANLSRPDQQKAASADPKNRDDKKMGGGQADSVFGNGNFGSGF